jgi:hypothetical protein
MVEADSEEATSGHLKAWQDKRDLLAWQRQRLTELVHELTTSWNPQRSEAAQALVGTLTDMIAIIDAASARAASTLNTLQAITGAIGDARKELQTLAGQYHDKATATREFNKRAMPFLPDSLNPATPVVPLAGLDSLALKQHQDGLDERARAAMGRADTNVSEAAGAFQPIPVWSRYSQGNVYDPIDGGQPAQSAGATTRGQTFASAPVFNPPAPTVPIGEIADPAADPPNGEGPILTGDPTSPPSTVGSPAPIAGPPSGIGVMPPPVSTAPSTSARWLTNIGAGQAVMRPGGVIGDEGVTGRPAVRAFSPVDGVIGGRGSPTGERGAMPVGGDSHRPQPGRARYRTTRGVIGGDHAEATDAHTRAGGWRDRSYERYTDSHRGRDTGDPDNPWEVLQGVPPVLEAPQAPGEHDAGPGVIGVDR